MILKKVCKHCEHYHREICSVVILLALLLTPALGQALASYEERSKLMDRLDPGQSEKDTLRTEQLVEEHMTRYYSEELGNQTLDEEAWKSIKSGSLDWFRWGETTTDIPTLLARRDLFFAAMADVGALVYSTEEAGSTVVLTSSASDASLSDAPVDNLLVLQQIEEIYHKISQILTKQIYILKMMKIIATLKFAFMPKIQNSPPYYTLCSSYMPPGIPVFPKMFEGIDLEKELSMDKLVGEFTGFELSGADLIAGLEEETGQAIEDLEDWENMEFPAGGLGESLGERFAQYKAILGEDLTVEELLAHKDDYSLLFKGGPTGLTEATQGREKLKNFAGDVDKFSETRYVEKVNRNKSAGGPMDEFATDAQENIAGTKEQLGAWLKNFIAELQVKLKTKQA